MKSIFLLLKKICKEVGTEACSWKPSCGDKVVAEKHMETSSEGKLVVLLLHFPHVQVSSTGCISHV